MTNNLDMVKTGFGSGLKNKSQVYVWSFGFL